MDPMSHNNNNNNNIVFSMWFVLNQFLIIGFVKRYNANEYWKKKHTYAHKSNYVSNYVRYIGIVLESHRNSIMLLKVRLGYFALVRTVCQKKNTQTIE